ncbi:hypothetical protein C0995_000328, partial [Termitomyces sp. Mi166
MASASRSLSPLHLSLAACLGPTSALVPGSPAARGLLRKGAEWWVDYYAAPPPSWSHPSYSLRPLTGGSTPLYRPDGLPYAPFSHIPPTDDSPLAHTGHLRALGRSSL